MKTLTYEQWARHEALKLAAAHCRARRNFTLNTDVIVAMAEGFYQFLMKAKADD
jgi:hypothetical protein|tara:strand:- start:102 stop:263 length:162 start_codon:yes stop_codon:yes gene_type:complete